MLFLYLYNSVAYRTTSSPILTDWAFLLILHVSLNIVPRF